MVAIISSEHVNITTNLIAQHDVMNSCVRSSLEIYKQTVTDLLRITGKSVFYEDIILKTFIR